VSLTGGVAAAGGAMLAVALSGRAQPSVRGPALTAGAAAVLAGAYDDLIASRRDSPDDKGVTGHLAALRAGRVSGGVIKVGLIGVGAVLASSRLERRRRSDQGRGRRMSAANVLVGAGVIAASANMINLFDLRPGRALKVTGVTAAATLLGSPAQTRLAAAVLGAAAATVTDDLAERTMLGDLGANGLGALLGVRLASGSAATRIGSAVILAALTGASERASFSRVIEATPILRWADELGRAPRDPAL
jgi:hypothetical protein